MKADRLISVLMLLQAHQRLTARELAERLEVSERTIHRDMEALGAAGVPVVADRGAKGGWRLLESYETDLTGLKESEARALLMTLTTRATADLGHEKEAEAGYHKLLAALPARFRAEAAELKHRIHIDPTGWRQAQDVVTCFDTLQEAVWRQLRLSIRYQKADASTVERLIEPLGLVAKGSLWYVIASVEGDLRSFRASRILDARLTEEGFERPDGFDLAAYWAQSMGEFRAALPKLPTTVRLAPEALPRLKHAGRYSQVARLDAPGPDGWCEAEILFQSEADALEYALGFGPRLTVVAPSWLREQVIAEARALLERYGV